MRGQKKDLIGTFWPSSLQEELLAVALGEPGDAVEAWLALEPRFSLDVLEPGSFAALPLAYVKLLGGGYDGRLMPRLKGIYRKSWVVNSMLLERTKETNRVLAEAEISALFIEGATFAKRFYPDLGLRPSSLVDVLVREDDAERALARLPRARWSLRRDLAARPREVTYLSDETGGVCALRTALAADFGRDRDAAHAFLWEAAEQLDIEGTKVLSPAATDALLAVCAAHARAWRGANLQWILDAKMLLGLSHDWERLLAVATAGGQTLRLRHAMAYLNRLPGALPPGELFDRLAVFRPGRRERLGYRCASGAVRGLGGLPAVLAEHLADSADDSIRRTVIGFPRRLQHRWGLDHGWQVPIAAGRRAIRRLGSRRAV